MIEIFGPTYKYSGEILDQPEVIYINDHHYNEDTDHFPVKFLLENSACDPQQHLLVFDHLGHDDVLAQYPHVNFPVYLATEVLSFCQHDIQPNWANKTHCFNFMINKPRFNRISLLRFVEEHRLINRCHTLPWQYSEYSTIPVTDYRLGEEVSLQKGIKNRHYTNALTYQKLLKSTVFEPTCVSLITEPCWFEREVMITEKTIMAMYSGTLPIWVGGWRLPDCLRELGFDVFDDIVDHSYSTLPAPQDRIDQALQSNFKLLSDFEMVSEFVSKNYHRLQHNLDLIKQNVFLNLLRQQVKIMPQLQQIADRWGLNQTVLTVDKV
jgi:hypothetical protein